MEIKWRPSALQKLSNILIYLSETAGTRIAMKFVQQIDTAVLQLSSHPKMAPMEISLQELPYVYRSLVVGKNYKIIYRIDGEVIHIFSIFDCRQNPDKMQEDISE